MRELDDIYNAHSDSIDSIVSEFAASLERIINQVNGKLSADLTGQLKISDGAVSFTSRNRQLLVGIDGRFQELLNDYGYQELLDKYIESFNGQFEWFNEVLAAISGELQYPLPAVTFTKFDLAAFDLQRNSSKDLINSIIDKVASRAKQQALQSIGGLNAKALTLEISKTLGTTLGEAENLADTSIATFYRTITDKGFSIIEDDLPNFKIRYNYNGPLDKLTRPFCIRLERLSRNGKTWTRAEIMKMNNGQLPNVFTTCGGFRCRHQWGISLKDLNSQQASKGKPEPGKKQSVDRGAIERGIRARRAVHAMAMQNRLGVPHPHEQIAAIRAAATAKVEARRVARV